MLQPHDVAKPNGRGHYNGPLFRHTFITAEIGKPVEGVFLGNAICYEVHWFRRAHRICTMPSGKCYPCDPGGTPTRPVWYAFAQIVGSKRTGVLKLTSRMILDEPEFATLASLRGVRFTLNRVPYGPKGRETIHVAGTVFDASTLPTCPDVAAFVLKMYDGLQIKE